MIRAPLLIIPHDIRSHNPINLLDYAHRRGPAELREFDVPRRDDLLDDLDRERVELGVPDGEVLEKYADEVEFLEDRHEGRVSLDYHREELQAEEGHRVLVGEDHAVEGEELLQDQLVQGVGGVRVVV